ncbi:hypothetical protein C5167_020635 [Papaver somniferum]|uniref:Uncharacterized protein n=1 Tax=Papaver somniferum TaxID=3469 RepID=A0A4Y7IWT6_PAPSO|nr:hypothetical protein C5167_020635 [Papaver somniferum]
MDQEQELMSLLFNGKMESVLNNPCLFLPRYFPPEFLSSQPLNLHNGVFQIDARDDWGNSYQCHKIATDMKCRSECRKWETNNCEKLKVYTLTQVIFVGTEDYHQVKKLPITTVAAEEILMSKVTILFIKHVDYAKSMLFALDLESHGHWSDTMVSSNGSDFWVEV